MAHGYNDQIIMIASLWGDLILQLIYLESLFEK